MNYSGGTEIGGLLSTNVLFPMKACGFHGGLPGTDADIIDREGQSVPAGVIGELVMRAPTLGMTKGLWKEPERYIESYWSSNPGVWTQGDLASRDEDGIWFIHGRADDTIKVAGKRVGPTEIENAAMSTGLVAEVIAVGEANALRGQVVSLAVVLNANVESHEIAKELIGSAVANALGKPFMPERVVILSDLPKTRNGKLVRRVVRDVLNGAPTGDVSGLGNPEIIDELSARLRG